MFRIYMQHGCPYCEKVIAMIKASGSDYQSIPIGGDPVILAGLQSVSGLTDPPIPIVVDFVSNTVIVGYKEKELADAITARFGAKPSNSAV